MLKKIQKIFYQVSEIMEVIMAVIVAVAVLFAIIRIIPEVLGVWNGSADLMLYLGRIFSIVIAVEFLKMLCKPTFDTVIEVLIFLVARHMIITETTPLEDLIAVISILLLYCVEHFIKEGLHINKSDKGTEDAGK